ncbi:hypothetical protein CRM22_006974 [Opisthorchis felineus]|uniref:Uncharacterized protein n=1 Tax=Opisthorchis felineus TaxID=147828 RepID=A0A4S2LQ14_OPIFE|nr:hypothetical protein CRM22_006974 [Opisthorchis felineus]
MHFDYSLTFFTATMNFNFSLLGLHNASLLPMSMLDAVASIDWLKEPYVLLLFTLHMLIFLSIIIKRNQLNFLIPILFVLLFICSCASWINELAATYSSYIVSDQYFDSYGLFISLIWSFPALLNCFVITVGAILPSGFLYVINFPGFAALSCH